MTDDEINQAIHKACGWEPFMFHGEDGENHNEPFAEKRWRRNGKWMFDNDRPNYACDLNAMCEAWFHLSNRYGSKLRLALLEIVQPKTPDIDGQWLSGKHLDNFCNATARQRAEAIMRLKGKWPSDERVK